MSSPASRAIHGYLNAALFVNNLKPQVQFLIGKVDKRAYDIVSEVNQIKLKFAENNTDNDITLITASETTNTEEERRIILTLDNMTIDDITGTYYGQLLKQVHN